MISYDLARISRDAASLAAFHALCTSHRTTLHTVANGPITVATCPS